MIHKFEGIEKDANARDNIYVFIVEAHRSVARELGTFLMGALPNSTIVGFIGTPIARTELGEGTFKIFGADEDQGYMDKYSIAESIEDETTLLIRRMDAVASVYRLAATLSLGTDGLRSRVEFHRRGRFDAIITLHDSDSFGVVRQDLALRRRSLYDRLRAICIGACSYKPYRVI